MSASGPDESRAASGVTGAEALRRRRNVFRVLALAALVAVAAAVLVAGRDFGGWAARMVGALRDAGPGWFFAAMAVLPAFGFPLLPFVLAAGPVFAPVLGARTVFALALAAVAVDTLIAYWLARQVLRPLVQRLLAYLGYAVPELPAAVGWQAVFLVRLAPGAPFWVQSYVLGLMRVPPLPYLVGSVFVPGCYLAAAIFGSDALLHGRTRTALIAFGLLGLLAAAIQLVRKLRAHALVHAKLQAAPGKTLAER